MPYTHHSGAVKEATAHWIGDPSAAVVLLYFHGGAYFQPATSGTFLYVQNLTSALERSTRKTVAALVVAYSLAPEASFPTQIQEGVALLRYLVSSSTLSSGELARGRRKEPGDVYLAGDSAGGNIALGVVSHILNPWEGVEEVQLREPLGGMVLFSPSVTGSAEWNSMRRNGGRDMLPVEKVAVWRALYGGQVDSLQVDGEELVVKTNPYLEPCVAGTEWWKGLTGVVKRVLVMSGRDELFADPIRRLGEDMRAGLRKDDAQQQDVLFVETPGETHIGPIVSFMKRSGKGDAIGSERVVEEWWKARIED